MRPDDDPPATPPEQPPGPPPVQPELPPRSRHEGRDAFADFGEPDVAFPGEDRANRRKARDARANLDLDLGRIKRRKRYGIAMTLFSVLFIAFVLAPVTWVAVYRVIDPPGTLLMMQRAAEGETIRYRPVPISRMSPHMVRSVIASEDANFCTHDGSRCGGDRARDAVKRAWRFCARRIKRLASRRRRICSCGPSAHGCAKD